MFKKIIILTKERPRTYDYTGLYEISQFLFSFDDNRAGSKKREWSRIVRFEETRHALYLQ